MPYCRNCGNELREGAKFCPKCGLSISGQVPLEEKEDREKSNISESRVTEPLPFWQKLIFFFIPPVGAIAAILLWSQMKISKAKSALFSACFGLVFLIVLPIVSPYFHKEEGNGAQITEVENVEEINEVPPQKIVEETKKDDSNDRIKKLMMQYSGKYYYSCYIGDTNAQLYFYIVLNSDGSFIHKPSNEDTEKFISMSKLIDGADYPEGGKWEVKETVAGPGIFMEFDDSWGKATINPENNCLEIGNMNGYKFKTILKKE